MIAQAETHLPAGVTVDPLSLSCHPIRIRKFSAVGFIFGRQRPGVVERLFALDCRSLPIVGSEDISIFSQDIWGQRLGVKELCYFGHVSGCYLDVAGCISTQGSQVSRNRFLLETLGAKFLEVADIRSLCSNSRKGSA